MYRSALLHLCVHSYILLFLQRRPFFDFSFHLKVSNPCVAMPQAAPLSSNQQLGLCKELKHTRGTSNGLPPCSPHGMQVHLSYITQQGNYNCHKHVRKSVFIWVIKDFENNLTAASGLTSHFDAVIYKCTPGCGYRCKTHTHTSAQ